MQDRIRRWLSGRNPVRVDSPPTSSPAKVVTVETLPAASGDVSVRDAVDDIERDILFAMNRLTKELGEVEQLSAGSESGSRTILESAGSMRMAVGAASENASALAAATQQVSQTAEQVDGAMGSAACWHLARRGRPRSRR
jgi:methyl-accepting chemotaxis protein